MSRPSLQEIRLDPASLARALAGLDRSSRIPDVLGAPRASGDAFHRLTVGVFGAGSIGSGIADRIARLGVRALLVVDPARFKLESTITHPIGPEAVGRAKAPFVASLAKAASPETRVFAFEGPLQQLPTHVLAACDVALLASDNLLAEVDLTTRCAELGIPLIQGSVYGAGLVAQVRSLANDGAGPCLCCGYGPAEWQALEADARFSCQGEEREAGDAGAARPTASMAHLCAVAADLALMELTRRSLGLSRPDANEEFAYRGALQSLTRTRLTPRPDCPVPHARSTRVGWERDLAQASVAELLRRAGGGDPDVTLSLENHVWTDLILCACDRHRKLARFLPEDADLGVCQECNVTRLPHPFGCRSEVSLRALAGRLDQPLAELGAVAPGSVFLRGNDGTRLFHAPLITGESDAGRPA